MSVPRPRAHDGVDRHRVWWRPTLGFVNWSLRRNAAGVLEEPGSGSGSGRQACPSPATPREALLGLRQEQGVVIELASDVTFPE